VTINKFVKDKHIRLNQHTAGNEQIACRHLYCSIGSSYFII